MPQAAQQEYLYLEIDGGATGNLTNKDKQAILDLHKRGLLFDTVLVFSDGDAKTKIIADFIGLNDTIVFYDPADGIIAVDVAVE